MMAPIPRPLFWAEGIALDVACDCFEQDGDLALIGGVQYIYTSRCPLDGGREDPPPLEDISHKRMRLANDQRQQATMQLARARFSAGPPAFHHPGQHVGKLAGRHATVCASA